MSSVILGIHIKDRIILIKSPIVILFGEDWAFGIELVLLKFLRGSPIGFNDFSSKKGSKLYR